MRIIASINQKGGVGKTTISANLAYCLSEMGNRVLAIDLDPQAHLGQCFGHFNNRRPGVDSLLKGEKKLSDVAQKVSDTLQLVTAGPTLQRLEVTPKGKGKGLMLKKALEGQCDDFDVIVLDCPPSSGFLIINALAVASELLIPVTADYFGLSGISQLMATVRNFEKVLGTYSPKWVVVNRYQRRKLSDEVMEKLGHYFKDELMPTKLHERAAYAESPSHGMPLNAYAPNSAASREFKKLAIAINEYGGK